MFLTTVTDVAQRMSERGFSLRLDDNPGAVTQVLRQATNAVLKDLLPIYNQSDLQNDALSGGPDGNGGMTKDLATDLAVCMLAARRGNTVAASFKDICKDAREQLKLLKDEIDQLPNVPQANPAYPAWSNVRWIGGYTYTPIRVETQISDLPPTNPNAYVQRIDWFGSYLVEY
jgi:hypothetical protein